jgi:hypothetical protein
MFIARRHGGGGLRDCCEPLLHRGVEIEQRALVGACPRQQRQDDRVRPANPDLLFGEHALHALEGTVH